MMEVAFRQVAREEIFEQTGIQFMQFNSLFQLLAMRDSQELETAATFLTIPDLLNYWLCGVKVCEFTNATTTQLYDQRKGDWSRKLIEQLELPKDIYPLVVKPGTVLGPVLDTVFDGTSISGLLVIAPACHDTGSAVAAIPVSDGNFGYISSGTWSLVGVEVNAPVITSQSLAYNLTNEGGVAGSVRLLKNVMGLWLIQECRRIWARQGGQYAYRDLIAMAEKASPWTYLIDPDYHKFLHPTNIEDEIITYCTLTQQKPSGSNEPCGIFKPGIEIPLCI
jgi:rhamnulokinase